MYRRDKVRRRSTPDPVAFLTYVASILAVLNQALAPVGLIIVVGYLLRRLRPGGMQAPAARQTINQLVMYVFYPALVLDVVTPVTLSSELIWVPVLTALGVFTGTGLGWFCFSRRLWGPLTRPQVGVLMLACGFSNTISLGLPVLGAVYGEEARRYGIYTDVLAIAPLLWILGIWVGLRFGGAAEGPANRPGVVATLIRLPPIWAFVAALGLNLTGVSLGEGVGRAVNLLGWATIPCMLLTVGMSLSLSYIHSVLRLVVATGILKLFLVPGVVYLAGRALLGPTELVGATALEAAMPTMMATIIISERFGLDTELLAAALAATTLMFFATAGVWILLLP